MESTLSFEALHMAGEAVREARSTSIVSLETFKQSETFSLDHVGSSPEERDCVRDCYSEKEVL